MTAAGTTLAPWCRPAAHREAAGLRFGAASSVTCVSVILVAGGHRQESASGAQIAANLLGTVRASPDRDAVLRVGAVWRRRPRRVTVL